MISIAIKEEALLRQPLLLPAFPEATFLERVMLGPEGSRRTLLCGPVPVDLARQLQPADWCQPFGQASGKVRGATALPLLGVFTPWEDSSFDVALVTDYWRRVPPMVALGIVAESARVASTVTLICHEEPTLASKRPRPRTLEECAGLLESIRSEYSWDITRVAGVTAFLVSRHFHSEEHGRYR